jgi:hypothetical protein
VVTDGVTVIVGVIDGVGDVSAGGTQDEQFAKTPVTSVT